MKRRLPALAMFTLALLSLAFLGGAHQQPPAPGTQEQLKQLERRVAMLEATAQRLMNTNTGVEARLERIERTLAEMSLRQRP